MAITSARQHPRRFTVNPKRIYHRCLSTPGLHSQLSSSEKVLRTSREAEEQTDK